MARELTTAAQQVREGRALAAALQDSGAFPDVAIKMVEVGESTGALQEMLNSLADFYDEEIDTNLGRFVTIDRAGAAGDHGHRDRRPAAVAVHAALQPVVGAEQLRASTMDEKLPSATAEHPRALRRPARAEQLGRRAGGRRSRRRAGWPSATGCSSSTSRTSTSTTICSARFPRT